MSEATKDQIGVEFDKVKEDVLASLGEVKRLAIKEAWKVMQVVIGELVMLIEKIGTDLSSTEKKELAMNLLSGFYDSVFKVVDLPFIPNVFEPLFHSYVKKFVMGLASAGIDAIVTTFREIGVFLKNKVDSNPYSPETLEVSYVK
jgi:hypothetical protein